MQLSTRARIFARQNVRSVVQMRLRIVQVDGLMYIRLRTGNRSRRLDRRGSMYNYMFSINRPLNNALSLLDVMKRFA